MRVKVLGSAAGGGFPQWNCGCSNCFALRAGTLRGRARTQTQLAFSVNSKDWFLLNASPDLRTQILAMPELAPPEGSRRSPVAGVFLTSADVDSVAGLLHLRESTPLCIFSTPAVQRILREENSMFRVLDRATPAAQWREYLDTAANGSHCGRRSVWRTVFPLFSSAAWRKLSGLCELCTAQQAGGGRS